jgi:hypothetical protein
MRQPEQPGSGTNERIKNGKMQISGKKMNGWSGPKYLNVDLNIQIIFQPFCRRLGCGWVFLF